MHGTLGSRSSDLRFSIRSSQPDTSLYSLLNDLLTFASRMLDCTKNIYNDEPAVLLQQYKYKSVVKIYSKPVVNNVIRKWRKKSGKDHTDPPHTSWGGSRDPIQYNVPYVPTRLHPNQNVDPSSCFSTAHPHYNRGDRRRVIDRNSLHPVYSIRPTIS